MSQDSSKNTLKIFFIKLIAITFSIIVIINITYNLIFAEKLENINKLLTINNKENIEQIKNKIRIEIKDGLSKDKIFNEEDKMLLYHFYFHSIVLLQSVDLGMRGFIFCREKLPLTIYFPLEE